MTSALAGFKDGRISRRRITREQTPPEFATHTIQEYEPKTREEYRRLNEAAQRTCAWETTWQTEETWK